MNFSPPKVDEDVAEFLETAPAGFVICSFGSYFTMMERDTLQMFADGFALLPYRVLWQTNGHMSNIKLADNVKIVKWVPLAQIMSKWILINSRIGIIPDSVFQSGSDHFRVRLNRNMVKQIESLTQLGSFSDSGQNDLDGSGPLTEPGSGSSLTRMF